MHKYMHVHKERETEDWVVAPEEVTDVAEGRLPLPAHLHFQTL